MSVNEHYEKLYAEAVAFIIPTMRRLTTETIYRTEEKTRMIEGIKRWTDIVTAMKPSVPVDLDEAAIEAIARSYK